MALATCPPDGHSNALCSDTKSVLFGLVFETVPHRRSLDDEADIPEIVFRRMTAQRMYVPSKPTGQFLRSPAAKQNRRVSVGNIGFHVLERTQREMAEKKTLTQVVEQRDAV